MPVPGLPRGTGILAQGKYLAEKPEARAEEGAGKEDRYAEDRHLESTPAVTGCQIQAVDGPIGPSKPYQRVTIKYCISIIYIDINPADFTM
jgi:hypothetical protein